MTDIRDHGDALQNRLLPGVSRTFALTIPELPPGLRSAVTNAYLLCRIADTIEDEISLTVDEKQRFQDAFVAVVDGRANAARFASELEPLLSDRTLPAEHELIRRTTEVVAITHALAPRQRAALERCVRIMCAGMPPFQRTTGLAGLADVTELDQYCYCVAGVVGEMLTDLFCAHDAAIESRRDLLAPLATSFGQALQMTNIIKDVWTDRERGVCWFPRDVFSRHEVDLATLSPGQSRPGFGAGVEELIALAHAHLQNAFRYTLAIPATEAGIRRFCLWALGLAVLTLRKIHGNAQFLAGESVKISRQTVRATVIATSISARNDWLLGRLFTLASAGLPLSNISGQTSAGTGSRVARTTDRSGTSLAPSALAPSAQPPSARDADARPVAS